MSIVTVDVSQGPGTPVDEPVGVKVAFQEIVAARFVGTVYVLWLVLALLLETVIGSEVYFAVPEQLLLSKSSNTTVPLAAVLLPVVIVALSFGTQVWDVDTE